MSSIQNLTVLEINKIVGGTCDCKCVEKEHSILYNMGSAENVTECMNRCSIKCWPFYSCEENVTTVKKDIMKAAGVRFTANNPPSIFGINDFLSLK